MSRLMRVAVGVAFSVFVAIILAIILSAAMSSKARAEGAYIGAMTGMMVVDSTVTVGGTKLVDLGGDMPLFGLRGGYGWRTQGGFYLGAEAELFAAYGRSRAVVNGQQYSYEVNNGAGAYARVGWWTQEGALFFARAGVLSLGTNQERQTIPSFGIGAEVPFGRNWAARLDAGYSWNDIEHYTMTGGIIFRF